MEQLKFGLIGCGRIAGRHALQISGIGILKAVCDIRGERAEALGSRYHAGIYTDINHMLEQEKNLDVISVCTPNGLHARHSILALQAGHHVLCEKPMAITVEDCRQMIGAAEQAGKKLFIVKQNRFNPPVEAVKRLLDEDRLGRICSVQLNCYWNREAEYYAQSDWKGSKNLDGGTLFTQFSHFIDLLWWMFGDVAEVQAYMNNFRHRGLIDFEDTGVVILRFAAGILGSIHFTVNSCKKNMEGSLTVFGEKGTVKIGGQYLNELEYQSIEGYMISDLPKGNPPNEYGQYQGSMSNHDKVYRNIVEVLEHGAAEATNGEEGLKTVEIIRKIYDCAGENFKSNH